MKKVTNNVSVDRNEIEKFLADELKITHIRDYCPNGLQVEGQSRISCIVSGVTASRALIEAAIDRGADTLLVHHGYFWRNEDPCITGIKQKRIRLLLEHNINLLAYHLPLDCHPELGNNSQLGRLLGFVPTARFGENELGWLGHVGVPGVGTVADLAGLVAEKLGRKPMVIGNPLQKIDRIGWCSGAAQELLADAARAGASVYLSGEVSEQTYHEAMEYGVSYLACGHHATEKFGVAALGRLLSEKFGLYHEFVDVDNPV